MVQDKQIARPGSRIYKGIEVPINTEIKVNKKGQEYYESGLSSTSIYFRLIESGDIIEIKLNSSDIFNWF
jgi:hypothetical protein